jgi:predicted RNA binding protein YcfA (HicA-like mRNA interferase family)
MQSRIVIQMLEENGWVLRRVKGSHHQFKHPKISGTVTVPHPTKDIASRTLASIMKQAQLN